MIIYPMLKGKETQKLFSMTLSIDAHSIMKNSCLNFRLKWKPPSMFLRHGPHTTSYEKRRTKLLSSVQVGVCEFVYFQEMES